MARVTTAKSRNTSRANGCKSNGPRTEAGKKISSSNALKHGLAAEHIVIPGESMGRFDDLLEDIIRRRPNAGELELTLLRGLTQDLWRFERARHLSRDAHLLRMEMQQEEVNESWSYTTADLRAVAFSFELGREGDIENYALYESRIHRHIKQTLQELQIIEELLPQLDEPGDDPYEEEPDDVRPDGQGPQIVPFPEPPAGPVETEETNEAECDPTPMESAACEPSKFKPNPLAQRLSRLSTPQNQGRRNEESDGRRAQRRARHRVR